jgi:hypothetical protein
MRWLAIEEERAGHRRIDNTGVGSLSAFRRSMDLTRITVRCPVTYLLWRSDELAGVLFPVTVYLETP